MTSKYLLVVENDTGTGFSAWFPDLPGVYAVGDSERQVEVLARQAANEELAELSTLPAAKLRSSRQIELLLKDVVTEEALSTVFVELTVPRSTKTVP